MSQPTKFLIIGLGNYNMELTRHSVGYQFLNELQGLLPSVLQIKLSKTSQNNHQINHHLLQQAIGVENVTTTDWHLDKRIGSHHAMSNFDFILPNKRKKGQVKPKVDHGVVDGNKTDPHSASSNPTEQATSSIQINTNDATIQQKLPRTPHLIRQPVELHFVKPYTFMNTSGPSVQKSMKHFSIPLQHLIVVHDELDEVLGTVKWKWGGSTNGHNGLKSVSSSIGSPNFLRCKVGIGRPKSGDVTHWVLTNFKVQEKSVLEESWPKAIDGFLNIIAHQLLLEKHEKEKQ